MSDSPISDQQTSPKQGSHSLSEISYTDRAKSFFVEHSFDPEKSDEQQDLCSPEIQLSPDLEPKSMQDNPAFGLIQGAAQVEHSGSLQESASAMNFGSVMSVAGSGFERVSGMESRTAPSRGVAGVISSEMDRSKPRGYELSGSIVRSGFRDFISDNRGRDKKVNELVREMSDKIGGTEHLIRSKIMTSTSSEIIPFAQKAINTDLKALFESLVRTESYQRVIRDSNVPIAPKKVSRSRSDIVPSKSLANLPSSVGTAQGPRLPNNSFVTSQGTERSTTEVGPTVLPSRCTSLETSSISGMPPVQCHPENRTSVIKEEKVFRPIDLERGPCGMFSEGFSKEAAMSSGEKCCHDFLVRGLQSYYYGKMYKLLASMMTCKTDKQVYESCVNNSFLKLDNFEISIPDASKIERTPHFINAVETLKQLHARVSPIEKIACMFQFGEYLKDAFIFCWGDTDYDLCADIFVPIVIIAVIRTRPTHLFSDVEFVRKFGTQDMLRDQWGYYLTNLESAAYFIEKLSVEGYDALKIDKEEYLNKKTQIFADEDEVRGGDMAGYIDDDYMYETNEALSRTEPEYTNLRLALLKIFSVEVAQGDSSPFGIREIPDLDSLTVSQLKTVCKQYSRMVDVVMSAKMYLNGSIDPFK